MGFFGRMLGIEDASPRPGSAAPGSQSRLAAPTSEAQALERYRYMLRTAPPETLEQAHTEAFAQLSPEQRQQVLTELTNAAPAAERAAVAATALDDPKALARVATRTEVRQPGTLERSLGSGAMGFGANLLSGFAMGFVGSMVAQTFFSALPDFAGAGEAGAGEEGGSDQLAAAEDNTEDPYADDGNDFGDDYEV